jgi:hypothetical protein
MDKESQKCYWVAQKSGTYADVIEAFGVAKLIQDIIEKTNNGKRWKVKIVDNGNGCYEISPKVSEVNLDNLEFFQPIKFIKKEPKAEVPGSISDWYDFPKQKEDRDEFKRRINEVSQNSSLYSEEINKRVKKIKEEQNSEFAKKLDEEFDVYQQIIGLPYSVFEKVYYNFYQNKENFSALIKHILRFYSGIEEKNPLKLKEEKVSSQQLFDPNQGKGLNQLKANNLTMKNVKNYWVPVAMKISGALEIMTCQFVKVGQAFDLKVYVPDFNQIELNRAEKINKEFKRYLKSTTPIKLDILNLLNFSKTFIEHSEDYNEKPRNTVKGIHAVYQKSLGQNRAVTNIALYEIPDFIEYSNKEEGYKWIRFIENQVKILQGIEERGDAVQGLLNYRNFLSISSLESFFKFIRWYATYIQQELSQIKWNQWSEKQIRQALSRIIAYRTNNLNQIFSAMDNQKFNLKEIIESQGFQAIAKAIKQSTVSLQYTPPNQRVYEVKYGMAQQLQNKARSSEDLATFIGDFVAYYNASNAKVKDDNLKNNKNNWVRANVKDEELNEFYKLLDKHSPRLVGALLSSYGFALTSKEAANTPEEETEAIPQDEQEN